MEMQLCLSLVVQFVPDLENDGKSWVALYIPRLVIVHAFCPGPPTSERLWQGWSARIVTCK